MNDSLRIVVVVPTYNEAENIPLISARIAEFVPNADMLVMDDGSPDGTADCAEQFFASDRRFTGFKVVRRTGQRGLGRAYRDGFQRALAERYDRIIQMDADLSHDPAHLPAMLAASRDAGLVIGSRYCAGGGVQNWPASRIFLSRYANRYVHAVAKIPVADATAGFRCWTRQGLDAVEVDTVTSEGYSFQVEMSHRACRAGVKIVETPITFTDRQFGQSKISRGVLLESFLMPWKLRLRPWQSSRAVVNAIPVGSRLGHPPK